jgi:hypothetical protein
MEEYDGAITDLKKAVSLEPENIEFYSDLAEGLVVTGRYAEIPFVASQMEELASSDIYKGYLPFANLYRTIAAACQNETYDKYKAEFPMFLEKASHIEWSFTLLENWITHGQCPPDARAVADGMIQTLKAHAPKVISPW